MNHINLSVFNPSGAEPSVCVWSFGGGKLVWTNAFGLRDISPAVSPPLIVFQWIVNTRNRPRMLAVGGFLDES